MADAPEAPPGGEEEQAPESAIPPDSGAAEETEPKPEAPPEGDMEGSVLEDDETEVFTCEYVIFSVVISVLAVLIHDYNLLAVLYQKSKM